MGGRWGRCREEESGAAAHLPHCKQRQRQVREEAERESARQDATETLHGLLQAQQGDDDDEGQGQERAQDREGHRPLENAGKKNRSGNQIKKGKKKYIFICYF